MKCANCGQETPPNLRYCEVCGAPVDLSFSKVATSLLEDQEERRLLAREKEVRNLLAVALFIFPLALTAFLLVPEVPVIDAVPAPLVRVELVPKGSDLLEAPPIIPPLPE